MKSSVHPQKLLVHENGRSPFRVAVSRREPRTKRRQKAGGRTSGRWKELSSTICYWIWEEYDIGRITLSSGPWRVTEYKMIHKYSKIMHICSQVEGNIKPGLDDCSRGGGPLPGRHPIRAPKIRACGVFENPKSVPRKICRGALGYLDFTGNHGHMHRHTHGGKTQAGKVTVQGGKAEMWRTVFGTGMRGNPANKAKAVIQVSFQAGEVDDR